MTEPTYDDWMALSREEYARYDRLLASLDEDQWLAATECPGWRVREMVAHLVGAGEGNASFRETMRQVRLGRRLAKGRDLVDGMNDVQVRERDGLSTAELRAALADVAPRAVAGRRSYPRVVRAIVVPWGPPVGTKPFGYLMGRIYTRDLWMHRVDISRAVGVDLELTPDHDAVLVADAVREWAATHGRPYRLQLAGPAGGTYASTSGAPTEAVELDAVELMRCLSGRSTSPYLLGTTVPF